MKKIRRGIVLCLIMAMITMTLGACAKKDTPSTNGGDGTTDTNKDTNTDTNTDKKDAVMLKWIQIGTEPNNLKKAVEKMNEYSIEKIGVGVEFVYLDWGVWPDRVTAMINSGEPFDLMFTNIDKYSAAVSLGAFADITQLLEEVPNLKDFIPEKLWNSAKIKGNIYAVPTYKDSSQTQYWVWDKALVEKYNIDYKNIHTVEELDPVLTLLQKEINAGNITDIDYAMKTAKDGINGFLMNYEGPTPALGVRYDDEKAEVVNVFEQEDIMTTLKYMHKWYKEGIVNPDAATVDRGPSWVIVSSGQGYPGSEISWGVSRGNKDVVAEPFLGPLYSTVSIMGSANAISSNSKYKAEALKYLELCNTDSVMRNMLAYGVEGEDWTANEDGTINRKEDGYNPATYSQATYFNMYAVAPNGADQWEKVKEWNETAETSVLLGFTFDRSNVEDEIAACELITARYKEELYTGTANPEEVVPKLYQELEGAGIEKVREDYQKQINQWMQTK